MSTKFFNLGLGIAAAISGRRYTDGGPVEFQIHGAPITLAIQGWHNISAADRTAIIAALAAAGWIDAGQSKPDE